MSRQDQLLESISASLATVLGASVRLQWAGPLSGGDINQAALLSDGRTRFFLKYHLDAPDGMFAAEAQALAEIAAQGCIRVPAVIACGSAGRTDWLVLEHLELTAQGSEALLGEQLAALHRVNADQHGWNRDNYIGSTPQRNTPCPVWHDFWRYNRLGPQLEMARGYGSRLATAGNRLLDNLPLLLADHRPAAALLHGDLWAGNKAFTRDGQPVLFDPASYYGDRETDIAMTALFGGFGAGFYSAYEASYPLPDGHQLRRELYKLYHLLNHLNLFGGSYLSRCERVIQQLLAQVL